MLIKPLNEVGYETDRGQLMLTGFLNMFKFHNMKDNLNYFMGKVDKLICEIIPELKSKIKLYKSIEVGQTIP
ncbi:MAG: hypothetical protein ACMUEM_06380 [Flavobacteriales bacterium AspAUS03]